MTQYARIETRSRWLSQEFGEGYARRIFGDELVDAMPRYVRGQRKGQLKGKIEWMKVARGGWVSAGVAGYGHVENRSGSVIAARLILPEFRGSDTVLAMWEREAGDGFRLSRDDDVVKCGLVEGNWFFGDTYPAQQGEEA